MTETLKNTEEFEYQAEMKQLLHLIVHSLYTHPEIFLRELISNASDALNKVRILQLSGHEVLENAAGLQISIRLDPEGKTLSVEDTGIGMTHDDLVRRIGTVASSGTLDFLEELKRSGGNLDARIIGQFGVGFYSVFMVADEVTIETRHADPDSKAYRWTSRGEGTFTIEPVERPQRGTTITLKLKEGSEEFSREDRIRQIVQRYSNFVDFPIYLGEKQINTVKALWRKQKSEITEDELNEFYKFISHDYETPLGHLLLSIEGRVSFQALLFIPAESSPLFFRDEQRSIHLYANNVFIQDNARDLLPEYLRFVRGVVDTEDLPLNVSREVTQSSPHLAKMRSILTGKILTMLEEWMGQDPEKYERFFRSFGPLFKTGVASDFANRDQILRLLQFESTKTEKGKYTTLRAYVDRMKEEQQSIYYALGEHRDLLEHTPNLEYFKKNDIEVLLLTDPVDVFITPSIPVYEEKNLVNIAKADLDLRREAEVEGVSLDPKEIGEIVRLFKNTLGDRVEDVVESRRLVQSAVTLVVGKEGMDSHLERMMKMMGQDLSPAKRILEINPVHPVIKNILRLHKRGEIPLMEKTIFTLYEGALLIEGNLENPTSFIERMTELVVEATDREA